MIPMQRETYRFLHRLQVRWAEVDMQQAVTGFYRRLGFSSLGEPYAEAGIAHIRMRAALG